MTKKFRYTKAIREICHKWSNADKYKGDVNSYIDGYFDSQNDCLKIIDNNIVETEEINIEEENNE